MDGKTMIRMHFSSVAQVCSPCVQLKKKTLSNDRDIV